MRFDMDINSFINSEIHFSIIEWSILSGLLLFFIIQLLFYFLLYRKPYVYEKKRIAKSVPDTDLPPISVVIASKNESENLAVTLPFILEQDYPNFEVVVVNSGSTDETDMLLTGLKQKYPHLYYTYIPKEAERLNEKKLALTVGIKAAKNDILLFTEAFCKPVSNQWIREFAKEFTTGKDIVLGFCKYNISRKVPMRRFIQYDNLIHSLKYLSMAIVRKPFMGIGKNMAYRKEYFFREKGYSSILNIDGGEDDLFINSIANKENTAVVISPESFTESNEVTNFATWRFIKSKYLYTKQFYKGARSFIFGWETFTKYSFYVCLLLAIQAGIYYNNFIMLSVAALLFILRYMYQLFIINKNSKLFSSGLFHIDLFFMDIFQPFNNLRFKKWIVKRNRRFR